MAELVVEPILDGYAYRDSKGTWDEVRNGVGMGFDDTFENTRFLIASDPYASVWRYFCRTILLYDVSSLLPSDNIISATLEVYAMGWGDALGISPAANVFSSSPASNTGLCAADYQCLGSIPLSTKISYATWASLGLGWRTFTLNAQGLTILNAAIAGDGIVKLGLREANYEAPDIEPPPPAPWKNAFFQIYTTEKGVGYISRLRIIYNPAVLPSVITDPATDVDATSATLNGTLDDDGGDTCDCGFEWGETIAYEHGATPTQSRTTGQSFSWGISGLSPSTLYHFRAFATNDAGTSYGVDRTFTTDALPPLVTAPAVTTNPATGII